MKEILAFAMSREREAVLFYERLAKKSSNAAMRKEFLALSRQEQSHWNRLNKAFIDEKMFSMRKKVADFQLSNYVAKVRPVSDMEYADLLVVAMHREKLAEQFYRDAAFLVDGDFRDLFLALAEEEAAHKHKFEVEFDESYFSEN